MKVAIRADGGENIGMGHIERCLALSRQLKKKNAEVIFVFQKNKKIKERIEKEGFWGTELKEKIDLKGDLRGTSKIIKEENIDIGIIAVPDEKAQDICNILCSNGIKGIMNFAPVILKVPEKIVVNNINLCNELESITYFINLI